MQPEAGNNKVMKNFALAMLVLFCVASNTFAFDRAWLGMSLGGGFAGTGKPGSNMFDGAYAHYDSAATGIFGGSFVGGLTLNIQVTKAIGLATGLNYRFVSMSGNIYYKNDSIEVSIIDHTINVPALLRFGFEGPNLGDFYILEGGVQKEVLFSSSAKVSNKRLGIKDKYSNSDFREESDFEIVFGLGFGTEGHRFSFMLGVIIPTAKLDKYDGIPRPTVLKMDINFPLFGF